MKESTVTMDIKGDLINLFRQHTDVLESGSGKILNTYREQAFRDFDQLGIPTAKNEAYRYTPLDKYLQGNYDMELNANPFKIDLQDVFKCNIPELDTHVILMLNGFFYSITKAGQLPGDVLICGLNEASIRYPELFHQHYSHYADTSADGLVALNTLFAQDGVFIYVPPDTVVEKSLQIINLSHSFKNLRITRRNLVIAGDNARVNIVVCDHTLCQQSYLANSLTEVYAGRNALIDFNRLQNENSLSTQINNLFVHQEESSRFTGNSISLHGGLIRNNFYVKLHGRFAETNLYGLFLCAEG